MIWFEIHDLPHRGKWSLNSFNILFIGKSTCPPHFEHFKLQRQIYKHVHKVPKELEAVLDQDTFDKARLYQLDKSNFSFYSEIYSQFEMTVSGLCQCASVARHATTVY